MHNKGLFLLQILFSHNAQNQYKQWAYKTLITKAKYEIRVPTQQQNTSWID